MMVLTRSQVYAIVREVINYKKYTNDTTDITAHVENSRFSSILSFINENADHIVIKHSDQQDIQVTPHKTRLKYLFNLPKSIEEEYEYCMKRNSDGAKDY